MRVDAHQHFWALGTGDYGWITPELPALRRDYGPEDLEPLLRAAGIEATVAVQAADTVADTEAMLRHADAHPWVAAVVGWAPLLDPAATAAALDGYGAHPRFRGVRHLVHDEPDPDWLARPTVARSMALLAERGLVFEVPAEFPRHLEHVAGLAEQLPDLRIVVDHLAKPPIARGAFEPWAAELGRVAALSNVYAKVSGLGTTTADPRGWSAADLEPYVDFALECFGADRLMFGSDWPVCLLAGDYGKVWRETLAVLADVSSDEREAILGGTAARLYGLGAGQTAMPLPPSTSRKAGSP